MWFYFALLSALSNTVGTIARKTHGSTARPVELAWWTQLVMVPFSLALIFLNHQPLYRNHGFIAPTIASSIIYFFAAILIFVAYKYGETSVVTPLGNLLPVGLLIASFLMFGTVPPVTGVSGKHNLLKPFQAIWSQKGSRAMLAVVFCWVIGTNLDKISLRSASPCSATPVMF